MNKNNWLYENNKPDTHRYIIGESGKKMIACIGLNPSTARPNKLDQTMQSVKRIAHSNGFDGWVMYNLSSQRATDPTNLDKQLNLDENLNNLVAIKASLKKLNINTIWLAWGDLITSREYLEFCLYKLNWYLSHNETNFKFKIVQKPTVKGNPRHPLYKKANSLLHDFDFSKYVEEKVHEDIIKKYEMITLDL